MPITTALPLRHYCQEEFGKVAYEVVHHAFEVHDSLGRIFHESIYRSNLNRILGNRRSRNFRFISRIKVFERSCTLIWLSILGAPSN